MTGLWLRRALLLAACASAALLAACGSSTVVSAITPTRFISFGDAFADMGQTGAKYTVNDGNVNNWTQQVAASFGPGISAQTGGGLAYAQGNARITLKPDAAGSAATPTITEQLDNFLASNAFTPTDMVVFNAGTSDIVVQVMAARSGAQSSAQAIANVQQAGRELGAQIRRAVTAGAKYVVVTGPYNLGVSPWAISISQTALLQDASTKFTEELLVSVVDLGANVLYVDAVYYFNLLQASPSSFGFTNATTVVCTSVDPGTGIGIGPGEVNSRNCNSSTIGAGLDYNRFIFADKIYPTPAAHRLFGEYAFTRIRDRW